MEKALKIEVEGLYNTIVFFTKVENIGECGLTLWYNDKMVLDTIRDGYKMVRDYSYSNIESYKLEREDI